MVANDLNPACFQWSARNARLNKVTDRMHIFNMDAREFIRSFYQTEREEAKQTEADFRSLPVNCTHIYMNLPGDAIEFLDVLKGLLNPEYHTKMPVIHVYGFAPE